MLNLLGVIIHNGKQTWYQDYFDIWVLDWVKYHGGNRLTNDSYTFCGIEIVDQHNCQEYLQNIEKFKREGKDLHRELQNIIDTMLIYDWWEVEPLYPRLWIDFDNRHFSYPQTYDMSSFHAYIPDGWTHDIESFTDRCLDKFWIIDGKDYFDVKSFGLI
jgi:hypothetical protein